MTSAELSPPLPAYVGTRSRPGWLTSLVENILQTTTSTCSPLESRYICELPLPCDERSRRTMTSDGRRTISRKQTSSDLPNSGSTPRHTLAFSNWFGREERTQMARCNSALDVICETSCTADSCTMYERQNHAPCSRVSQQQRSELLSDGCANIVGPGSTECNRFAARLPGYVESFTMPQKLLRTHRHAQHQTTSCRSNRPGRRRGAIYCRRPDDELAPYGLKARHALCVRQKNSPLRPVCTTPTKPLPALLKSPQTKVYEARRPNHASLLRGSQSIPGIHGEAHQLVADCSRLCTDPMHEDLGQNTQAPIMVVAGSLQRTPEPCMVWSTNFVEDYSLITMAP